MPTTFDGPGRVIQPPSPEPPAEAAPPPTAGWLARTCCQVVGHTGDWTYPDERCVRVRMCERCGEITSKQEHTWAAFEYLAADRCEQERRCDRCGAVESRVLHRWGPWLYVGPDAQLFRQSTPAVAVARRNIPATFLRTRLTCPSLSGMDTGVGGQNRPGASVSAADRARRAAGRPGSHEACRCIASSGALAMS